MNTEANKSLVRRYDEAINRGEFDTLDQFFGPDYKRYPSATGTPLNADGQKKRMAGLGSAFPGFRLTEEDIIAESDRVAIRLTARGTHKGTILGIPPTGKLADVTCIEIFRLEEGKIIEHWGGPDMFEMLQKIGAVVSAGK